MEQIMKKRAMLYGLLMSIFISLFLSLYGLCSAGQFTVPKWLVSFALSAVISIIWGFIIPMKKISMAIDKAMPNRIVAFFINALVSDIIYTPLITAIMIYLAARKAPVPFSVLYLKSIPACFIVCFFVILIFQFVFRKLLIPPKMD